MPTNNNISNKKKNKGIYVFLAVALLGLVIGGSYLAWKKWGKKKDNDGPTNPGKPQGGGTSNPGFAFTFKTGKPDNQTPSQSKFKSYNFYLVENDYKNDPDNNNCLMVTSVPVDDPDNKISDINAHLFTEWTTAIANPSCTNGACSFTYPVDFTTSDNETGIKYDEKIVNKDLLNDNHNYYIGVQAVNSHDLKSDIVWGDPITYQKCNTSDSNEGCIPASGSGGISAEFI